MPITIRGSVPDNPSSGSNSPRIGYFDPVQGPKSSGNCTLYRYKVKNRAGTGPCTRTRSKFRRERGFVPVQGPNSAGNDTLHRYKVQNRPGTAPCTRTRSKIRRERDLVPVQGPIPARFRTLNGVFPARNKLILLSLGAKMPEIWENWCQEDMHWSGRWTELTTAGPPSKRPKSFLAIEAEKNFFCIIPKLRRVVLPTAPSVFSCQHKRHKLIGGLGKLFLVREVTHPRCLQQPLRT